MLQNQALAESASARPQPSAAVPAPAVSPMAMADHRLSWTECHQLTGLLADAVAAAQCTVIAGISRSGLVPAVMLSHALGIRDFAVLDLRRTVSDAVHSQKRPPLLCDAMNLGALANRRVLLVDDIVGAGATLVAARALLEGLASQVVTAALVYNRANDPEGRAAAALDHHACLVHGWVEFPWECKDLREAHHA